MQHLLNGRAGKYNFVEFKLHNFKFKKTNHKCGWFLIENNQISGPISINSSLFEKEQKRIINDSDYPDLIGLEIVID